MGKKRLRTQVGTAKHWDHDIFQIVFQIVRMLSNTSECQRKKNRKLTIVEKKSSQQILTSDAECH